MPPDATVIIPTLATAERGPYLKQAIASILAQRGTRARILVVANGRACSESVLQDARAAGADVLQLTEADLPAALAEGRRQVSSPYFAELDDDDLLLEDSLAKRMKVLQGAPELNAVISNGYTRTVSGRTRTNVSDMQAVRSDPLRTLMDANWLLAGAVLFRTADVGPDLFAAAPRYLERTYIAARLALDYRIAFIDEPLVVYHVGHEFSVDASREAVAGRVHAFDALLKLRLPADVRRRLRERAGASFHALSDLYVREGRIVDAWRWHMRSLCSPGGLRYLSYTRHLVGSAPT